MDFNNLLLTSREKDDMITNHLNSSRGLYGDTVAVGCESDVTLQGSDPVSDASGTIHNPIRLSQDST
jgi:hypothetical protein